MPEKLIAIAVGCGRVPGISRCAEADEVGEPGHLGGQLAGRGLHLQVPHRRGEDRAAEVRPLEQGPEPDAAAHGVRDEVARPGQVEPRLEVEQRRDVELVGAEVLDVPEHGVGRMPVGQPLAAPVDRRATERPRATSRAATRPYFSANSVRPGKITAVPCAPAPPYHRPQPHAVRGGQPVAPRRPPGASATSA